MTARIRAAAVNHTPQLLLILLLIVVAVVRPSALAPDSLRNIVLNAVPIALLGLGAMWVLIGGGLDLSAGYGVSMCALVMAARLSNGDPLVVAIVCALAAGLALGLVNGILVSVLGVPAFIATLATMVGVEGITLEQGKIGTVIINNGALSTLGVDDLGPIPVPVIFTVGVAVILWWLARSTRFGIRTYGIGSDRDAMLGRGIRVTRNELLIYLLGGLMTAITAIILVAHIQVVGPNISGLDELLDAFAATIIGGTSLFGGKGSVGGTITGALIISLATTSLIILGVGAQDVELLKGAIIVAAVVVDAGVRAIERPEIVAGLTR